LYERRAAPHDRYVQLRYNGTPLALPSCAPSSNAPPAFCQLDLFRQLAAPLVPTNFDDECKAAHKSKK
jgi:hypothetical protein